MARYLTTDTADDTRRDWFEIDGQEYALTSDGRILDANGMPLTDSDTQTQRIRRAIEAVR